jgi:hypothetical protein
LIVGLALSAALAAMALSSLDLATVELALAANQQWQQDAFYAAESGIAEAFALGTYTTRTDPAQFLDLTAREPFPRVGSGTPIAACQPRDGCEYFIRYDARVGPTIDPRSSDPAAALAGSTRAYHFVIDSIGRSTGGARTNLQAGFYVLAPAGTTDFCAPGAVGCAGVAASRPVLSYWRQSGVD